MSISPKFVPSQQVLSVLKCVEQAELRIDDLAKFIVYKETGNTGLDNKLMVKTRNRIYTAYHSGYLDKTIGKRTFVLLDKGRSALADAGLTTSGDRSGGSATGIEPGNPKEEQAAPSAIPDQNGVDPRRALVIRYIKSRPGHSEDNEALLKWMKRELKPLWKEQGTVYGEMEALLESMLEAGELSSDTSSGVITLPASKEYIKRRAGIRKAAQPVHKAAEQISVHLSQKDILAKFDAINARLDSMAELLTIADRLLSDIDERIKRNSALETKYAKLKMIIETMP